MTKTLIETIIQSNELQRAVLSLRLAWHAIYPEYTYRRQAIAPDKLARQFVKSNTSIAQFTKGKGADHCRIETVSETVTTTLRRQEDITLKAVDQFIKCISDCGDDLLCVPDCFGTAFVDVVVGTLEVVETIAETVVSQILVCPTKLPNGQFPNPFTGLVDLTTVVGGIATTEIPFLKPGPSSKDLTWLLNSGVATPEFPDDVIKQAQGILTKLFKNLSPVVECLVAGDWKITNVGDLGLNIIGVASVPFGVTVCVDRQCMQTILSAGGFDGIGTIVALVKLAPLVPAAVAVLGLAVATAALVVQACTLFIALIAILLAHLVIVAGQILLYEALGILPNGVCITHPTLPVVAAAAINPLLGILAVGNTPLVVTPA